jgi:hypothetical protein
MHWMVALLLAATPPQGEANAEEEKEDLGRQKVSVTTLVGSGLTLAAEDTAKRSPTFLLFDVGLFHPEHRWLEFSPAVMMELEGGLTVGAGLRLRAFTSLGPLRLYAIGGLEGFFAPRKLLGIRLGAGVTFPLHPRFSLASELGPTVYFAGNDIIERSALTKMDATAGIRVNF